MIKEITKPTSKQTVAALKSGDFSEVYKIRESAKKDARKVFDAVSSGAVSLIWYDLPPVRCQSGAVSIRGGVGHAVRSASVNQTGGSLAAVMHGD